jgi:ABC-type spermidine/putrescine transport system permease subunit II
MFSALRDSIDPTIAVVSSLLIVVTSALIMLTFVASAGPGKLDSRDDKG